MALPKLRSDLQVSPRSTANGGGVVVKDPLTSRYFRFGQIEYFVAQRLDGVTPLEVVHRTVLDETGQPVDAPAIERLVGQFRRLGLLEAPESTGSLRASRSPRRHLLYLRLKAFDPDRLLEVIVPHLGFFFTRPFVLGSAVLVAFAVAVTVANASEITGSFGRLYRFDAFALAWATMIAVTIAHEFAHGVTCKRFGGRVQEMGFLLLYFQPAFYCNVGDAWLMPEKSHRLWVTFAGAYLEIVIWAGATVTWRLINPDTWISFVALVVMATSAIKTLFNLNPLIRLDGYYLLSDYLEIPNLRQKSSAYLRKIAGSMWRPGSLGGWRRPTRDERIFLGYGILAATYSCWLLTVIALRVGNALVHRYQAWGFVLFSGLLMMTLQRPLGAAVSTFRIMAKQPAPLRSWARGHRWLLLLAVAAALISLLPAELKVSGEFRILPQHNTDVRAQVDGIISQVYKNEGDMVAKGDLIASLADRDYDAELRKVDADIAEKAARLALLQAGPRREELAVAQAETGSAQRRREHGDAMFEGATRFRAAELAKIQSSVEKAEQRLVFAQNELDRATKLFAATLVPRKSIDDAELEVMVRRKELAEARAAADMVLSDDIVDARKERDLAEQEFERAQGKLKVLLAGSRPEEITATKAELTRLQAQREYLQQQLQLVHIASPAAGVVATPQLKEKLGQHVSRGDLIAKVYEQKVVTAEVMVSEQEIGDVHAGQTVVLKTRAYADRTFTSRVTAIAPIAMENSAGFGGRVVRVTADLDNRAGLLKSEMTGNAKIYGGRRRLFDLMTRRLVKYVRVEFWSWW